MASSEVSAPSRRSSLWRNRDYLLLWSGQAVSAIGSEASLLAYPLLVLALTNSPAQAGLMGAFRIVPYALLSLPAGALIDRWDRKRVMVLCDVGRAVALGSIPLAYALNALTIPQLYVVAFVEGTLFVFFNIAEVACLPRVVTPEQLPSATAQNQATFGVAFTTGQALGGALFGLGRMIPFLADAVSYTVSVFTLRAIRTEFQAERKPATRRLRDEIMEGLSWLWHQPLIRFIAVLTGGTNFVYAGGALIAIVLARHQHASSSVIGLMFGIGGLGGLAGALIAPAIRRRYSYRQVVTTVAWLWTLLWPLQALAPNPFALGVVIASLFVVGPVYDVVQFSYRLSLIPDELQGRVNSVFRLAAFGMQPLGLALTGWLLQAFGPITTILALTVPQLALAIATTLNKHVRNAPAAPGR